MRVVDQAEDRVARRLWIAVAALLAITAVGTAGYALLEGMDLLEALFMTVITLSTVGYSEVRPLSDAGRIFSILLIVTSVSLVLYLGTQIGQLLLELNLRAVLSRRHMQRTIDELEGHVIVCGFGRLGGIVVDELQRGGRDVVVIDDRPEDQDQLERLRVPHVIGSATEDEVLEQAGVRRAAALVAATASDATNVFITLAARELNPRIQVHARGESDAGLRRLRAAGAAQVVSAYHMGGQRMAMSILRPSVVDFLEIARPLIGEEVDLEEVRVESGTPVVGRTISEIESSAGRLRIVALRGAAGDIELAPRADHPLAAGEQLVVIGERSALERLSMPGAG